MPFSARICLWPSGLIFLFITGLLLLFILVGMTLCRRPWAAKRLKRYQWSASVLYNTMAVLYAILLGSLAVGVWDTFKAARQVAEQEAACMLGITRLVMHHPHPTPEVARLRASLRVYARRVVEEEYPAMGRMERSASTVAAFEDLWTCAADLKPVSLQEGNIQEAVLSALAEAQKARVSRLLASAKGLPGALWTVLCAGSMIIMLFAAVFDAGRFWPMLLLEGALVLSAALVIFAVVTLNHPFIGEISVTPDGWAFVLRHLQEGGEAGPSL